MGNLNFLRDYETAYSVLYKIGYKLRDWARERKVLNADEAPVEALLDMVLSDLKMREEEGRMCNPLLEEKLRDWARSRRVFNADTRPVVELFNLVIGSLDAAEDVVRSHVRSGHERDLVSSLREWGRCRGLSAADTRAPAAILDVVFDLLQKAEKQSHNVITRLREWAKMNPGCFPSDPPAPDQILSLMLSRLSTHASSWVKYVPYSVTPTSKAAFKFCPHCGVKLLPGE